jgi:hypothetical protein
MTMMAVKDPKFRIVSDSDPKVPRHPFRLRAEAEKVLAEAKKTWPEFEWKIVGEGPWGVHA